MFWLADHVHLFAYYTISLASLCKLIWRHWTSKMPVRYILSNVWVRLSIFSQLSMIQYMGLCVFNLPIPLVMHDDVIKRKHFPHYWPFVREIHRSPVNSPHKGQWRGALMFSLICVWINGWVNNRKAGDLRCYCAHYDVIVMDCGDLLLPPIIIIIMQDCSQALNTCKCLWSFTCGGVSNMLLVLSTTFHCHYNIWGCMCSTGPFQFRWLKGYIYSSCYYHHQIRSINLTHCYRFFLWLCAWDVWLDHIRMFVHYTISPSVRYILSGVWVRLSIFSQLSMIQYMGLCVFSLPISLVMIKRIYILCLIITIKWEV